MVTSYLLMVCFMVLLTKKDKEVRLMSLLCMGHILAENYLFYFFSTRPELFDISFYLTLCWVLDIILLFSVSCIITGVSKRWTLALAIPFLLCQLVVVQYPYIFPSLFSFSLSSSYLNFMETFIFVSSLKDTTLKEWGQTSIIIVCIIAIHWIV